MEKDRGKYMDMGNYMLLLLVLLLLLPLLLWKFGPRCLLTVAEASCLYLERCGLTRLSREAVWVLPSGACAPRVCVFAHQRVAFATNRRRVDWAYCFALKSVLVWNSDIALWSMECSPGVCVFAHQWAASKRFATDALSKCERFIYCSTFQRYFLYRCCLPLCKECASLCTSASSARMTADALNAIARNCNAYANAFLPLTSYQADCPLMPGLLAGKGCLVRIGDLIAFISFRWAKNRHNPSLP